MSGNATLTRRLGAIEVAGPGATESPWHFNSAAYDRTPDLRPKERAAIALLVQDIDGTGPWPTHVPKVLQRLVRPIDDALALACGIRRLRTAVLRAMAREMHHRGRTCWGWTHSEWVETLGTTERACRRRHRGQTDKRQHLITVAYLLADFTDWIAIGEINRLGIARKVFGQSRIDAAGERVVAAALRLGYRPKVRDRLQVALCEALLANHSPRLEDLTAERFDALRRGRGASDQRGWFVLGQALFGLGLLPSAPKTAQRGTARQDASDQDGVSADWLNWCARWRSTSTLSPTSRRSYYRTLFLAGQWLAEAHPDVRLPEQWTRGLAAEYVAALDRATVGQWGRTNALDSATIGKPIAARTKEIRLTAVRVFFRDLQEWGWIPRRFDPRRDLATPRAVRALIGPDPRVIADDLWAKLLWAGLNLTPDDLAIPRSGIVGAYPLSMMRALAVVWLFAGLRRNEIRRLRIGCIRWQRDDVIVPGTSEVLPKDAVCLLDVPVQKTGLAFTKPVDRVVGEAIATWERERPQQPALLDRKTAELVQILFACRGRPIGADFLNATLIPAICRKAGVPERDSRGTFTSHRARATIATQLFNSKEPLSLFELQAWLGHSSPQSTQHYARITPTRLAKAYADAGYFARNLRSIDVLIDRDAIVSGAAAKGQPWRFYDLGHGLCTYEFFDQCPHRMACAKCSFYRPKGSSQAQLLEAKGNLLHLKQEIPLTEEEVEAVDDGLDALERLLTQLADVPTPAGPTPRDLALELSFIPLSSLDSAVEGSTNNAFSKPR